MRDAKRHALAWAVLLLLSTSALAAPRPATGPPPKRGLEGIQQWLAQHVFKGLAYALGKLVFLPPTALGVINGVQKRRIARGDQQGAARLAALKDWGSYTGMQRGVPALAADLYQHKQVVIDIFQDWGRVMEKIKVTSPRAAWPELLVAERPVVEAWARRSLAKVSRAFKASALQRLLSEVVAEAARDPQHAVPDVLAELLPGRVSEPLAAAVRQLVSMATEAFPAARAAGAQEAAREGGEQSSARGDREANAEL